MGYNENGEWVDDYNPLPQQDWTSGNINTYPSEPDSDSYISDPWGGGNYYQGTPSATKQTGSSASPSSVPSRVSSGNTGYGTGTRQAYQTTSKAQLLPMTQVKSATGDTSYNQIPTYNSPDLLDPVAYNSPTISPFTMPLRDAHKLASYTQEAAAPGYAKLNRNVNAIAARVNDSYSPGGRLKLRDALAGVGEGYGNILEGAGKTGQSRYEQEYGDQYKTDYTNWQTKTAEDQKKAQYDWQSANQNIQTQNTEKQKSAQLAYQAELDRIWKMVSESRRTA